MVREFSAGGVVLRRMQGRWWLAAIEPAGDRKPAKPQAQVLALPKGLVENGEQPQAAAAREVREETGLETTFLAKLTDIKYMYVRSWGDGQRVFKVVSFFLFLYRGGKLGEISEDMQIEVRDALWLPLEEAPSRLAYRGEREVVKLAQQYVAAHPEL
jgi:8-oxo-dGTP pyrophosphatase MutT (NUDIX family)